MKAMALESLEGKNITELAERMTYWRGEYPDLDIFIASLKGIPYIVASDGGS